MLTTGLRQYLMTLPAITTICTNIGPIPAPVDLKQYPYVTYQQASDLPEYVLTGIAGISTTRIVFDCFAELNMVGGGYLIARNLALAVKKALSGYSGVLPDGTKVWFAEIANVQDIFNSTSFLSCTSVHCLVTYQD